MSVIVSRNMKISSREDGSGDEFRHRSSDDDADHRRTVRGHRCADPVRRYRQGSRPDLDITIGEHLEAVIRLSEPVIIADAWGARESELRQNLILGGLDHRQAAEQRL